MYWAVPAFGVIVSAMGVAGLVRGTFSVFVGSQEIMEDFQGPTGRRWEEPRGPR